MWVVWLLVICAVIGALLMQVGGRKAWEGALAGLVFGPLGVLVAAWLAFRPKPSAR
jgi:hypothetical protein